MKKIKISDFIQDSKNNNKHTLDGMALLENSINKVGVIESITVSNDNQIISGNARQETMGRILDTEPIVIETDGTRPIILKMTDIESNSKQFYEASILANTTAKKNIDFDNDVIEELAVEFDIDLLKAGIDVVLDTFTPESKPKQEQLKPYVKTHILLSFSPEKIMELKPFLDKILELDFVEYEQSSN